MNGAVLASLFCAVVVAGTAQPAPDFSGTWRFDANRSASATYLELNRPVTLVISQTPTEVRLETTRAKGTESEVARFGPREAAAAPDAAVARWRDAALVVDAVRDVRGVSVTVQRTFTLNADGSELVVESTVNVQHGYSISGAKVSSAGKDVFVRVK
jgi:hypothetical protein